MNAARVSRSAVVAVAAVLTACDAPAGPPEPSAMPITEAAVKAGVKLELGGGRWLDEECFAYVRPYDPAEPGLAGSCLIAPWQALFETGNPPKLFARYGLPDNPPLAVPGDPISTNIISYRLTWFGHPERRHLPRWGAPAHVDCTRRVLGGCFTDAPDPAMFELSITMVAANTRQPLLTYYWNADKQVVYGRYEPRGLYAYAFFYVGDVQVELRVFDTMQQYMPALVDLARAEMKNWVRPGVNVDQTAGSR